MKTKINNLVTNIKYKTDKSQVFNNTVPQSKIYTICNVLFSKTWHQVLVLKFGQLIKLSMRFKKMDAIKYIIICTDIFSCL